MNHIINRACCACALALFLSGCAELSTATDVSLPKIQNYDKDKLSVMVTPFGLDAPIDVGTVLPDGSIEFVWSELDIETIKGSEFFVQPITSAFGIGRTCREKGVTKNNESAKVVVVKDLSLYKYGKRVGAVSAATEKDLEISRTLGSSIAWLYSDSDAEFEASCTVDMESEGNYSFQEVTSYDLKLTKGWNLVQYSLVEKQDWDNQGVPASLPKTMTRTTLTKVPGTINWYMNYWANDELLDIEHNLLAQTPLNNEAYEKWLPSKLGDLERTSYEIGKELDSLANTSNVTAVFSGGERKIDLSVADSAGNKAAVGVFVLTMDMTGSEWKDDLEDGYRSSGKFDGVPVLLEFNSKKEQTMITFNANNRLIVKAIAERTDPEKLWSYLKELQLDQLK